MSDIKSRRSGIWFLTNPVLRRGEPGHDATNNRIKIGDGETPWRDLTYLADAVGTGGGGGGPVNASDIVGTLADIQIPASIARDSEVNAAVSAAVASLVNSAPATLDTFTEIASALGNDPNLATTLTTLIGTKYTKPAGGIPASDLSFDVATQAELDAAIASVGSGGSTVVKPTSNRKALKITTASTAPQLSYIDLGMTEGAGVYGPSMIDVRGKISNPINNYYMLVSTDHATGQGGLFLATAPHPVGPWTAYKGGENGTAKVYADTVMGNSTETPDLTWNPVTQQFHVYYQQAGLGGNQGTALAVTSDFLTYERIGAVITSVGNLLVPGDSHTGYARITRWSRNYWTAQHNNGGTSYSHRSVSYSYDGVRWLFDPQPMFGGIESSGKPNRNSVPNGMYFYVDGVLWSTGSEKNYSSAVDTGSPFVVAGPVHPSLTRWAEPPQIVWQSEGAGFDFGSSGFVSPITDDAGDLYFCYIIPGTGAGGGVGIGKASFVPAEKSF